MNDKIKNILKIAAIWYLIPVVLCSVMALLDGFEIFKENIFRFLFGTICIPTVCILCFLPTIFLLYLLCKKIKPIEWKIILVAFAIPFTNMIYYYIAFFIDYNSDGIRLVVSYPIILGLFLVLTLFIAFIGSLFTPKSLLPVKKYFIITELLMFAIGVILMNIIYDIDKKLDNIKIENALNKYEPAIEYIETYKTENGTYPADINNIKIKSKNLPNYEYQTFDNNSEYILQVNKYKFIEKYYYCSNSKYQTCHEGSEGSINYTKVGKWIKAEDFD